MADHGHHTADIPAMDYPEHERTYSGFVHLSEVATAACISIVAALAVGGTKQAWGVALLGTILTLIATGIGIASKSIGWRAPAVPLVFLLLALLIMPGVSH